MRHAQVALESIIARIYWTIHSQILRRILTTGRENIAYNTLPYKFARMLPLPHDFRLQSAVTLPENHPSLG
jgi:hypothetical protein